MRKFVVAAALLAAACSPAAQKPPEAPPADASQAVTVVGLSITDATARPPVEGQTTGVGYFTLRNTGETSDKLIAASSPATSSIELHTHRDVSGMKRMERVDAVEVPAGAAVVFQPGGLHLMLFGFAPTGEEIPVTLTFEKRGEVAVPFKIVARSAGQGETGHGMHQEHAH
ncbi:MAG: copper chaperone PCu(A)C [Alphaproteobacteria bacterium]|nr:copper chaperone PCu(A)C [Alphaproteobacteria bacterium]